MTATMDVLKVADIVDYLTNTGWQPALRNGPGGERATMWHHPDNFEVLVPASDIMGDSARRIREILRCLADLEDRPATDIASEIALPKLDRQYFKAFASGHDPGYASLLGGVQTINAIRNLLDVATRTIAEGPHYAFVGRAAPGLRGILRAAELGPTRAGSYIVEMRLAIGAVARTAVDEELTGRAVLTQMLESAAAAQSAVMTGTPAAFDDAVTEGVSANLCQALGDLCGTERRDAFEITFRWARAMPLDGASSHVLPFPAGSGPLLQAAGSRLRKLVASGAATVTGIVESLHDDVVGADRWRIKVRGWLRTDRVESARRAVWVRLADQASYDRAITAHREHREITVSGELTSPAGRVELVPGQLAGL
ncbi:hypothetical protein M1L60_41485 [Actinoplanes sp. TRM 88003]|uniref:Uncharacterized protein n=1 Tax=Paractinoplanes aksuensis TaxID=2939490 RepID=A0ABT1E1P9_9ACTN|nr:hypothetical protein [Actinoplanes aksuensis]MCO8277070.1 hypothetical protein [Actinoplanes aksuensis]